MSYLKTRVRASRLFAAAHILAIVELTRRLHQAYAHAYDETMVGSVLPQNTGQQPGTITGTVTNGPECNPDVIEAMKRAWARTGNGTSGNEAGFVLNGTPSNYTIVDTKSGNTKDYQSFNINTGGPNPTFLLFHVHPNKSTRFPSTPGNNALGNKTGDTGVADQHNLLFLVGHRTGLTLYDPKVGKPVDLRDNLDWLKACK